MECRLHSILAARLSSQWQRHIRGEHNGYVFDKCCWPQQQVNALYGPGAIYACRGCAGDGYSVAYGEWSTGDADSHLRTNSYRHADANAYISSADADPATRETVAHRDGFSDEGCANTNEGRSHSHADTHSQTNTYKGCSHPDPCSQTDADS